MTIRVLVADDHALMREGLRAILAQDRAIECVGEAEGGQQAVELAGALEPDVVLMDVAMPGKNGVEATREIRARSAAVRVLALSSHRDGRFVEAMLRAGANGYVLKGNAFRELRRAIVAVASGQDYLCPGVAGVAAGLIRDGARAPVSAFERLGSRERQILQLLAEGLSSQAIARRLGISASTVDTHRRNIMRKLDIHGVVELTRYAIREGLTSVDD